MIGWRLLLTRPADEAAALSSLLAEQGIFSNSLPLLDIMPIAATDTMRQVILALDQFCAVIVVSKPAARIGVELLEQYWPTPPGVKWFSVGAATAQILEDHGLDVSFPAEGDDSEALLELSRLREAIAQPDARVLIL
ncbi:uroporphyrinogen-III synthase, partial [Pseudomonas sp. ACN8]